MKDVGHAVLESYSRILETLAYTVLSRIDDVMSADAQARGSATAEKTKSIKVSDKVVVAKEETEQQQRETEGKTASDENADA